MYAYLNGFNLGWVAVVFLILLIAGLVLTLLFFIIPDKQSFHKTKDGILTGGLIISVAGLGGGLVLSGMTFSQEQLDTGKHWKTECRLLEKNLQTGLFTSGVNRLDCGGVFENVPTGSYERYIYEWDMWMQRHPR